MSGRNVARGFGDTTGDARWIRDVQRRAYRYTSARFQTVAEVETAPECWRPALDVEPLLGFAADRARRREAVRFPLGRGFAAFDSLRRWAAADRAARASLLSSLSMVVQHVGTT